MDYDKYNEYLQERYENVMNYDSMILENYFKDFKQKKINNKHARNLKENFVRELIMADTVEELKEVENYMNEIIRRLERELSKEEKNNTKFLSSGWILKWFKGEGRKQIQEKYYYFDDIKHNRE